jgi:hypothetical protein
MVNTIITCTIYIGYSMINPWKDGNVERPGFLAIKKFLADVGPVGERSRTIRGQTSSRMPGRILIDLAMVVGHKDQQRLNGIGLAMVVGPEDQQRLSGVGLTMDVGHNGSTPLTNRRPTTAKDLLLVSRWLLVPKTNNG